MLVYGVKFIKKADGIQVKYFYHEVDQKRTLEEMKHMCQKKNDNFGCIHPPPLINIDLDHVVPDELHLLLRITDRQLQNVIDEILECDSIADFNKPKGNILLLE